MFFYIKSCKMPFEIFLFPVLLCLVVGIIRGLSVRGDVNEND